MGEEYYSAYRYKGVFKLRRRPRVFLIIVIVLILSIAAGGVALYLGGFSFKDLGKVKAKTNVDTVVSPEMTVWTVEVRDLETKTAAISRSLSIKVNGGAGYIRAVGEKWTVISGVYLTSADATREMMGENAVEGAVADKITIPAREITVPPESIDTVRGVFSFIKTAFDTLVEKRTELDEGKITADDIALIANNLYAELKNKTAAIADDKSAGVTNVIYCANMDILALYNLFISNRTETAFASKLNAAIATLTFSLTFL